MSVIARPHYRYFEIVVSPLFPALLLSALVMGAGLTASASASDASGDPRAWLKDSADDALPKSVYTVGKQNIPPYATRVHEFLEFLKFPDWNVYGDFPKRYPFWDPEATLAFLSRNGVTFIDAFRTGGSPDAVGHKSVTRIRAELQAREGPLFRQLAHLALLYSLPYVQYSRITVSGTPERVTASVGDGYVLRFRSEDGQLRLVAVEYTGGRRPGVDRPKVYYANEKVFLRATPDASSRRLAMADWTAVLHVRENERRYNRDAPEGWTYVILPDFPYVSGWVPTRALVSESDAVKPDPHWPIRRYRVVEGSGDCGQTYIYDFTRHGAVSVQQSEVSCYYQAKAPQPGKIHLVYRGQVFVKGNVVFVRCPAPTLPRLCDVLQYDSARQQLVQRSRPFGQRDDVIVEEQLMHETN